jgi:protein-disulfide isomerase
MLPSAAITADEAIVETPDSRTPLAEVDGETLYVEDVEGGLALRIHQLRVDIYSLLESEARRWMDAKLLADAARERGSTVAELEAELAARVPEIDEAEVDRYLAEHPPASQGDTERVRERVRLYLAETSRLQSRIDFMESLREAAGARVLLPMPEPPRTEVDVAGAPSRGPTDAPVVIVHYASFGSRASARSDEKLRRLEQAFPGQIRRVHRNFLNDRDELGLLAARIGFAAAEIDRFWPFHDALFDALDRDGFLTPERVREIARASDIPSDRIEAAERDTERIAQVREDIAAGSSSGIPREPSLFINGLFTSGLSPYETIREIVENESKSVNSAPPSEKIATE